MTRRDAEARAEQALVGDDAPITPLGTRTVQEFSSGGLFCYLPTENIKERGLGKGDDMKVGHMPSIGAYVLIPADGFDGWDEL